jgi:type II secretory pathway component PulM
MRTRHSAGQSVDIETAIEAFFAATKGGQWPVSVADGVRRVRAQIGRATMSEVELAELIRRYAVQHGLEISPERKPTKPRRRIL